MLMSEKFLELIVQISVRQFFVKVPVQTKVSGPRIGVSGTSNISSVTNPDRILQFRSTPSHEPQSGISPVVTLSGHYLYPVTHRDATFLPTSLFYLLFSFLPSRTVDEPVSVKSHSLLTSTDGTSGIVVQGEEDTFYGSRVCPSQPLPRLSPQTILSSDRKVNAKEDGENGVSLQGPKGGWVGCPTGTMFGKLRTQGSPRRRTGLQQIISDGPRFVRSRDETDDLDPRLDPTLHPFTPPTKSDGEGEEW